MAHENPKSNDGGNEPESVVSYYFKEVFDFHLDTGNVVAKKGKKGAARSMPSDGQDTNPSTLGKVVALGEAALGLVGELMSLKMQATDALLIPILSQLKGLQGIACLPMAKHLDPVLGIDLHNVMFPPVAAPVPLPHPHIAMVFEAKDWVMCALMSVVAEIAPEGPDPAAEADEADGQAAVNLLFNAAVMAGSIYLGKKGMNATVKTGILTPRGSSGAKGEVVKHFPMGPAWHPGFAAAVDKDNCHLQFGSLFVNADAEPLAGLMHPCNICWDLGSPELARTETKPKPRQLFLPTGFVMAIPWNNVLVNPVPTPMNPQAALSKLLGAGFEKLKKAREDKRRKLDAMEGDSRPVSGKTGFLNQKRMRRSQLKAFKKKMREIGVEVVMDKKGILPKNKRAGFDPQTGTIYLRPGATEYEAFHEAQHAKQWSELGPEKYQDQSRIEKEQYVFDQVMKNEGKFSPEEIKHAKDYMHYLKYGVWP